MKLEKKLMDSIDIDSNEEAYKNQLEAIVDALQTYGVDMVEGVSKLQQVFIVIADDEQDYCR